MSLDLFSLTNRSKNIQSAMIRKVEWLETINPFWSHTDLHHSMSNLDFGRKTKVQIKFRPILLKMLIFKTQTNQLRVVLVAALELLVVTHDLFQEDILWARTKFHKKLLNRLCCEFVCHSWDWIFNHKSLLDINFKWKTEEKVQHFQKDVFLLSSCFLNLQCQSFVSPCWQWESLHKHCWCTIMPSSDSFFLIWRIGNLYLALPRFSHHAPCCLSQLCKKKKQSLLVGIKHVGTGAPVQESHCRRQI